MRVSRTGEHVVMGVAHLRDGSLSLAAKGLMSVILATGSEPEGCEDEMAELVARGYVVDGVAYENPKGQMRLPGKAPRPFVPPTLAEVEAYAESRGGLVDAGRFFDYYESAGWRDSMGRPVKSWKQRMITWERKAGDGDRVGDWDY